MQPGAHDGGRPVTALSADLKQVLRANPEDDSPLRQAIIDALPLKPERHYFNLDDEEPRIVRFMNMTGG